MMSRSLVRPTLLVTAVFVACAGTTCPVPSIGIECSNTINATTFGFNLTVPVEFKCTTVVPNEKLLLSVRYIKSAGNLIASVVVGPIDPNETATSDQVTQTELDQLTNPNGVTFRRFKVTFNGSTVTSYVGIVTLASGQQLGITLAALTDDPALLEALNAIINTVALVS
jgi:hypothetical protein